MRRAIVSLATALFACGESPSPEPVAPAPTPAPEPALDVAAAQRRNAEAEAKNVAAHEAEIAQRQKTWTDAAAQRASEQKAQTEAACTKSRPLRIAEVRLAAAYELKWQKDIEPKLAAIKNRCSIPTLSQVYSTGRGARVENVDGKVQCKGGPPQGITLEQAQYALVRDQGPDVSQLAVDDTEHHSDNLACVEGDRALGWDTQVKMGDRAGLEKLLAPPAPQ